MTMLLSGVTKRGETTVAAVTSEGGGGNGGIIAGRSTVPSSSSSSSSSAGIHHAAVHSLLQSRRISGGHNNGRVLLLGGASIKNINNHGRGGVGLVGGSSGSFTSSSSTTSSNSPLIMLPRRSVGPSPGRGAVGFDNGGGIIAAASARYAPAIIASSSSSSSSSAITDIIGEAEMTAVESAPPPTGGDSSRLRASTEEKQQQQQQQQQQQEKQQQRKRVNSLSRRLLLGRRGRSEQPRAGRYGDVDDDNRRQRRHRRQQRQQTLSPNRIFVSASVDRKNDDYYDATTTLSTSTTAAAPALPAAENDDADAGGGGGATIAATREAPPSSSPPRRVANRRLLENPQLRSSDSSILSHASKTAASSAGARVSKGDDDDEDVDDLSNEKNNINNDDDDDGKKNKKSSSSSNGNKSKSKKLWKKMMMKGSWKKKDNQKQYHQNTTTTTNINNADGSNSKGSEFNRSSSSINDDDDDVVFATKGSSAPSSSSSSSSSSKVSDLHRRPSSPAVTADESSRSGGGDASTPSPADAADSAADPSSSSRVAAPSSPSSFDRRRLDGGDSDSDMHDSLREGDAPFDDHDFDAPWAPTMSMLLKTGQLDCIESDSDEDKERSSNFSIDVNDDDDECDGGGEEGVRRLGGTEAGGGGGGEDGDDDDDHDDVFATTTKAGDNNFESSDRHVLGDEDDCCRFGGSDVGDVGGGGGIDRMDVVSGLRRQSTTDSLGHVYNFDDSDRTDGTSGGGGGRRREDEGPENEAKTMNVNPADGMMEDGSGRSGGSRRSSGYDVDDFMDMQQQQHRRRRHRGGGNENYSGSKNNNSNNNNSSSSVSPSISEYFDRVASSYLHSVHGGATVEIITCPENCSKADESTLSKEETVYSGVSKKGGRGKSATTGGGGDGRGSRAKSQERKLNISIRSIGETLARRGRSRGRRKKEQAATATTRTAASSGDAATASNGNVRGEAASVATPDSNVENVVRPRSTSSLRSRMNALRRSQTRTRQRQQQQQPQKTSQPPPRRGSSLVEERARDRAAADASLNGAKTKRGGAKSLPRRISRTTPGDDARALREASSSPYDYDDSRNSLGDSRGSCSLEGSELSSLQGRRKKPRRKRCLVCRQKIPRREDCVRHLDFYFCSNGCFQCTSCRRPLFKGDGDGDDDGYEEEAVAGLQIISNARGSILHCGVCAKSIAWGGGGEGGGDPVLRPVPSADEADDESGKASIHLDDSEREETDEEMALRPPSPVSSVNGADRSDRLSRAARRLAERAVVTLSVAEIDGGSVDDGNEDDVDDAGRRNLSTLCFVRSEESNHHHHHHPASRYYGPHDDSSDASNNTATKVVYELDSDAVGNPNYDGYACSFTNIDDDHEGPLRMTSVSLPKLESDEIDGTISRRLGVDIEWADDSDDESSGNPSGNNCGSIHPTPTGPAVLSIEQFRGATAAGETVMKVLRQTWEYEENHVIYGFSFVVPFKKIYISWEIDKGDELDLTQCRLEVTMRYDPPEEPEEEEPVRAKDSPKSSPGTSPLEESGFETNAANPVTSTIYEDERMNEKVGDDNNDGDFSTDGSMPNAVYVKTVSIDSGISSGAGASSLVITRRGSVEARNPDRDENDIFSELLSVASCINSIISLPSVTYVKVVKTDFECEVGLSLIEKNGATVVAEVSKSGLFANSNIKEGCEILAINGHCVRGSRSVMRIMKDVTGKVLVMVSDGPSPPGAKFVVKKHNEGRTRGFGSSTNDGMQEDISFETINGLVRVREVSNDGIFANSSISKGDICLSVDGVPAVNEDVATRAIGRSQHIVALMVFSLPDFWKSIVEFIIDEKFNRWWKNRTQCMLLWGDEDCTPITLRFDERAGLCKADGNEENEVDLRYMNIILDRVMKLFTESMKAYQTKTKERVRDSSRSLSVSASGKMKNRSDVYKRALIKLDELRENGTLSAQDYEAGRLALAQVAIKTAT